MNADELCAEPNWLQRGPGRCSRAHFSGSSWNAPEKRRLASAEQAGGWHTSPATFPTRTATFKWQERGLISQGRPLRVLFPGRPRYYFILTTGKPPVCTCTESSLALGRKGSTRATLPVVLLHSTAAGHEMEHVSQIQNWPPGLGATCPDWKCWAIGAAELANSGSGAGQRNTCLLLPGGRHLLDSRSLEPW